MLTEPRCAVFGTGNRCCLVRKHLRSIRAPCACPGRNLLRTGGPGGTSPPDLAAAGLGGIALGHGVPTEKHLPLEEKGWADAELLTLSPAANPPLHRGCSILQLHPPAPAPAPSSSSILQPQLQLQLQLHLHPPAPAVQSGPVRAGRALSQGGASAPAPALCLYNLVFFLVILLRFDRELIFPESGLLCPSW